MGLFGLGKKTPPVEEETKKAPVLDGSEEEITSEDDFSAQSGYLDDPYENSESDDFGGDYGSAEEEDSESEAGEDSYKGVTGEQILDALHKSDNIQEKVLGGLGGLSDRLSDLSVANVSENFTERQYGVRAKKIAFFGAGGGVGTSTMLLEIATRVAAKHKRVLLIDLNVMGGVCELILHAPIKGKREDLYTLLGRTSDLSNTVIQAREGIMTLGFRNRGMDALASVDTSIYGKAYDDLLAEVTAGYDFVFIDCGSDINYFLANNALYRADAGYIVTDGGLSSIQKLATLRTCFRYCGILSSGFGVISNKNTRSISSVLSDMDYREAGQVPYLLSIKNANLQGKLLGNDFIFAESAAVQGAKATLDAIAKEIVSPVVPPIKDSERKQDMEFDIEAKQKEGEA